MFADIQILGVRIDAADYSEAALMIMEWARKSESRYVCAANVHMVMEAYDSLDFRNIVNTADLVTPDGMPLVWGLKCLGVRNAERVYGPDLTLHILAHAEHAGIPVGFYGGEPEALDKLLNFINIKFPGLQISYTWSPPFRALTAAEDDTVVSQITASGSRILFVGLGCPRQEEWMSRHRSMIPAVMIGVGAAFDFIAGTKPQAPRWMMGLGLEWLFRLCSEPRRLWRRYFYHNPRFVVFFALQLLRSKVLEERRDRG